MTSALLVLLRDLATPSIGGSRYGILVIALAHLMAGAAVAALVHPSVPLALLLGALYFALKEVLWDYLYKNAPGLRDGVVDAVFVTLGLMYPGPSWWPLAGLSGALAVALLWKGPLSD